MLEDAVTDGSDESGWGHLASHDGAPAVVDTLLRLDPERTYTKTELSDEAGVPLKTLYLDGTLDHLVELGFLTRARADGEEASFAPATDSAVYEAAAALDDALAARLDE